MCWTHWYCQNIVLLTVGKCLRSLLSDHQEVSSKQLVQQWRMPLAKCIALIAGDGVERSHWRPAISETATQQSARYFGALLCKHQRIVTASLYWTWSTPSTQSKSASKSSLPCANWYMPDVWGKNTLSLTLMNSVIRRMWHVVGWCNG